MQVGGVSNQAGAAWAIKPQAAAPAAAGGIQGTMAAQVTQSTAQTSSTHLLVGSQGASGMADSLRQLGALALQMYIMDLLLGGREEEKTGSSALESTLQMLVASALLSSEEPQAKSLMYAHSSHTQSSSALSMTATIGPGAVSAAYGGAVDLSAADAPAASKLNTHA